MEKVKQIIPEAISIAAGIGLFYLAAQTSVPGLLICVLLSLTAHYLKAKLKNEQK